MFSRRAGAGPVLIGTKTRGGALPGAEVAVRAEALPGQRNLGRDIGGQPHPVSVGDAHVGAGQHPVVVDEGAVGGVLVTYRRLAIVTDGDRGVASGHVVVAGEG